MQGVELFQDLFDCLYQIGRHGTTDAAVGQLIDRDAEALEEFSINSYPTEFINQNRRPGEIAGPLQDTPKERGFPGSQKTGDQNQIA
jgi:hypothetical protein